MAFDKNARDQIALVQSMTGQGVRVVVADAVAVAGQTIAADTSGSGFRLTLPAVGGTVTVLDAAGSWGDHPLTVDGNGRTIDGDATFLANASGFALTFTSVGSAWRYALTFHHGA